MPPQWCVSPELDDFTCFYLKHHKNNTTQPEYEYEYMTIISMSTSMNISKMYSSTKYEYFKNVLEYRVLRPQA